jgi:hypothetical protein
VADLSGYIFVDCLLVDFVADKLLSCIKVITEAYYPTIVDGLRVKGLIEVKFNGIRQLNVVKNNEFEFDIQLPYDPDGDDVRANEVYSLEVQAAGGDFNAKMRSDFLTFELICKSYNICEVVVQ